MKIPKSHLALSFSGILALISLGIFLAVRQRVPAPPPVDHPAIVIVPRLVSEQPRLAADARVFPDADSRAVEEFPMTEPPSPKALLNLPAPAPLEVLAARYSAVLAEAWGARNQVRDQVSKDPELAAVQEAKLVQIQRPLWFITLSEALDDPLMGPAIRENFAEKHWLDGVAWQGLEKHAADAGIRLPVKTGARTAKDVETLVKLLQPHFQAEYERLLEKLQVEEDLARAFEPSRFYELQNVLLPYMQKRGFTYSPDRRRFEPKVR